MGKPRRASAEQLSLPLERIFRLYATYHRSAGHSEATVAWYEQRVGHFIDWFQECFGREATLADLTETNFQLFIIDRDGRPKWERHPNHQPDPKGISSAYRHGFFRAFRALGSWLHRKAKLLPEDPFAELDLPRLKEKPLEPLTEAEERRLLDAFQETNARGCRSKALIMLMLDCGLRRGEVVSLTVHDVHLAEGYLLVHGKGGKVRTVPFGYKTGWVVARYLELFRPTPLTPYIDAVFLDEQGSPMTANALKMVFERAKGKAGIPRLHPHLLRHTFGIRSQELGIPSLTLQQYMGHSDIRVTERYAHAAESERLKKERRFSHLDRMDVTIHRQSPRVRRPSTPFQRATG